jgi:hypothetical protein
VKTTIGKKLAQIMSFPHRLILKQYITTNADGVANTKRGAFLMANEKRLIDANAGKKAFRDIAGLADYKGVLHLVVPISEIDKLPTVDAVEVVHAEWLDGYGVCDNKKSYVSIDCSNCGEYFKIPGIDEDIEEWKKRFAYCPFCGAKMDGGNEDG